MEGDACGEHRPSHVTSLTAICQLPIANRQPLIANRQLCRVCRSAVLLPVLLFCHHCRHCCSHYRHRSDTVPPLLPRAAANNRARPLHNPFKQGLDRG